MVVAHDGTDLLHQPLVICRLSRVGGRALQKLKPELPSSESGNHRAIFERVGDKHGKAHEHYRQLQARTQMADGTPPKIFFHAPAFCNYGEVSTTPKDLEPWKTHSLLSCLLSGSGQIHWGVDFHGISLGEGNAKHRARSLEG